MKIFVSHSGDRSRALAGHVSSFVRHIIQATDPWISTGIEKGTRWLPELSEQLEASGAGIVCLTRENLTAPWILFESGALAKHLGDKVCTLLLDVQPAQVELPLGQFQHTQATDRDDVWKLVTMLSAAVRKTGSNPPPDAELRTHFDEYHWPRLMAAVTEIAARPAPVGPPQRTSEEMLAELLDLTRETARTAGLHEKTLRLVGVIYQLLSGQDTPSLAALRGLEQAKPGAESLPDNPFVRELLARELRALGIARDEATGGFWRRLADFGKTQDEGLHASVQASSVASGTLSDAPTAKPNDAER